MCLGLEWNTFVSALTKLYKTDIISGQGGGRGGEGGERERESFKRKFRFTSEILHEYYCNILHDNRKSLFKIIIPFPLIRDTYM